MIGRMYRPLKIITTPENRGYNILNKYKSNFGGTYNFETNIYLDYNHKEKTETIHIECKDLTIPVLVTDGILLKSGEIVSSTEKRTLEFLRTLYRPTNITSKNTFEFDMNIKSVFADKTTENDVLNLILEPVIHEGEEYLKITVNCTTPVIFHSNTLMKITE